MNYSNVHHLTLMINLDFQTTTILVHGFHTRFHLAIERFAGHSKISNCTLSPSEKVDSDEMWMLVMMELRNGA